MRVTAKINLAMRTLMFCAVNPDKLVQKAQIAKACNASQNHLAQIIQTLGHAGFVTTHRGRGGGLELARPASEIAIGDIFRALEAQLPFAECYDTVKNTCPLIGHCRLRNAFDKALAAFYGELDQVSLEDLICDNAPLAELLTLPPLLPESCAPKEEAFAAS
jgi:Rrf2 family nitric oxide-sensitive transcriptional repressor